jgi:hypothetical protein
MKSGTTTKKQNRQAIRKRRAERRFAFLKQLRRDTTLSSSAKMVVWSLADDSYNLETERCDPGFAKIAKNVGRSLRPTKKAIKEAKDAGWITFTSTRGGSEDCSNRYTPVWSKKAVTKPGVGAPYQSTADVAQRVAAYDAANPDMSTRVVAEALGVSRMSVQRARKSAVPPGKTGCPKGENQGVPTSALRDTKNAEIIEEVEDKGCRTQHRCPIQPVLQTVVTGAVDSTRTLSEPQRGEEEEAALAARGFAAPLALEEEMAFQQLCEMWSVRDQWHKEVDVAKAREAVAVVSAKYGDQIRAEHGVDFFPYLLGQAQLWITKINSAQYLPRLEAWLGVAPGFHDEIVDWWIKLPRDMGGGRRRKRSLLAIATGRLAS